MSALTAALYAALVAYLGGWYLDWWHGNFALLLLILSTVTGLYWIAETLRFRPQREAAAANLQAQDEARRAELARQGIAQVDGNLTEAKERLLMQPWWLDWTAGLFPVILIVFLMRSFLFEPFKIPTGSMIPTLEVGDLILVSKFHYGIRLPVANTKILDNHEPQRGDVVVFRYPMDTRVDYIKRVVGLPGDEVSYQGYELRINGELVATQSLGEELDSLALRHMPRFQEKLGTVEHRIQHEKLPSAFTGSRYDFPFKEQCRYNIEGVVCKVPPGHLFVMGDNRDNSEDSRYWGFVPYENLVGKAFFVWMNFGNPGRIGGFR